MNKLKILIILMLTLICFNFVQADNDTGLYNDLYKIIDSVESPVTDFVLNVTGKLYDPFEAQTEFFTPALDNNNDAKSIYSDKIDLLYKNYLEESAKRKEQALEDTQILEAKKQTLYSKMNYVLDLFLYVFILFKEVLILMFYLFEMYLILLLFLKIIPYLINWLVNSVSGSYSKVKGDKN